MAAMTVTVAVEAAWRVRDRRFRRVSCTFNTGDYAAGGVAIAPSDCDLTTRIDAMVPEGNSAGYTVWYDRTNGMLEIWYSDYDAGADGALIEHPASAMTANIAYFLVIGW